MCMSFFVHFLLFQPLVVRMLFVIIIIKYGYCHIAFYKMNCIVLLSLLYMYIVYYSVYKLSPNMLFARHFIIII